MVPGYRFLRREISLFSEMFNIRGFINKKVLKAVWPVVFGYIPLGLACGILAQKVGFDWFQMFMMSTFLFAGSGQFIALAMIGSGSTIMPVLLTVCIVNLRHLLYALILNQYVSKNSWLYKAWFAQEIVDETFAVNQNQFAALGDRWTAANAMGTSSLSHASWVLATVAGLFLGNTVYIDTALVSYALIAMFIGLWSFHFLSARLVLTGVFGGLLALVLSLWLDHMLNVVVATILAAAVAAAYDMKWGRGRESGRKVEKGMQEAGGHGEAGIQEAGRK